MWMSACLLVIIGIGQIQVLAEPIVSINEEIVTVQENDSGNVTCTASNVTFQDDPVVAWYKDDIHVVENINADVHQVFLGYDNSSINETYRVQLFFNTPATATDFEMIYTCKLTNESLNTANTTSELKVQIYVPLTTTSVSESVTTCINGAAILSCHFRSNPIPDNVTWKVVDDGNVVITDVLNGITKETELALTQVRNTTVYTCEANSTNFDGVVESTNGSITVNVRDDQLQSVTHRTLNSTSCIVEWNATDIMYLTGYQIKIEDDSEILVVYIDELATNFTWEMKEGDVLNITVAMTMSDCTGPYTTSNGNCTYIEQPTEPTAAPVGPDNTALIVVGTVLGVTIIVLAVFLGVVCYKSRRKLSMNKVRLEEMQRREKRSRSNDYSHSPARRRPEHQQTSTRAQHTHGNTNIVAEDENVYDDTIENHADAYEDVESPNRNVGYTLPPRTTSLDPDEHYEIPMRDQQDMRMHDVGRGGAGRQAANPMSYARGGYQNY